MDGSSRVCQFREAKMMSTKRAVSSSGGRVLPVTKREFLILPPTKNSRFGFAGSAILFYFSRKKLLLFSFSRERMYFCKLAGIDCFRRPNYVTVVEIPRLPLNLT
jgi:hypothetical protein